MAERIVEFDLANERVVIATMAHDLAARKKLSRELQPDVFGEPKHKVMFRALSAMARAGLEFSEDTLRELAGSDDFGGFVYLRGLLEDYEPAKNLDFHVERLRLDSTKYQLMAEHLPEISAACQDPKVSSAELDRLLRGAHGKVTRGRKSALRGPELADSYYSELRMRRAVGDVVEGTGFPLLDRCLTGGGFKPGLSVIVGRPGHGKTTWLANFLRNRVAVRKPTYVCGWEMDRADYLDMMVSAETGITASDLVLKVRDFSDEERETVTEAVDRFTDADMLAIEADPFEDLEKPDNRWGFNERNLDYFQSVLEQECDRYPIFAVDVVGKMLHDRRPDEISLALVRIRKMAKRLGVHVMLLHHLNRDAAQGRPTLEGIKGSGAFEEEADLIFGLDRPILRASPARRRKMQDVLDVHGLKQRKGPAPFLMRYRFDGAHYRLSNEVEIDVAMLEQEDGGVDDDLA